MQIIFIIIISILIFILFSRITNDNSPLTLDPKEIKLYKNLSSVELEGSFEIINRNA